MKVNDLLPMILNDLAAGPVALFRGASDACTKTALKTSLKATIYLGMAAFLVNELAKAEKADAESPDKVGISRSTFASSIMTVLSLPGIFLAGTFKLMQKGALTLKTGVKEDNRQKCLAGGLLFLLAYVPTTQAFRNGGGLLDRALTRLIG